MAFIHLHSFNLSFEGQENKLAREKINHSEYTHHYALLIGRITMNYLCNYLFLCITCTLLPLSVSFSPIAFQAKRSVIKLNAEESAITGEQFATTPMDDAVIQIKMTAMERLRELKAKQSDPSKQMILRMGVRNGGCSGLSYVMDFSTEEDIQDEDQIDEYPDDGIRCVVDAKSLLYLYGLELDYSDELIGGGFKFFNPNAEDSCGCGSSFTV